MLSIDILFQLIMYYNTIYHKILDLRAVQGNQTFKTPEKDFALQKIFWEEEKPTELFCNLPLANC